MSRLDARSRAHYVRSVIELIVDSMDTAAIARIRNAVVRWILIEPETIEHFRATMPGYRDWLALLDGEPIGVGVCARIAGMEESAAQNLDTTAMEWIYDAKGFRFAEYNLTGQKVYALVFSKIKK